MSFTPKPSVSMAPDEQEIVGAVVTALRDDPRTDKELARDTGHQPRTIKAWREGENVPHLRQFFRLCMELPELRARALRWLQSEAEFDPARERELLDLMRAASQVLERRQRAMIERGPP